MLSLARRIQGPHRFLPFAGAQIRYARTDAGSAAPPRSRRRSKFSPSKMLRKPKDKSEWWVVDGEMHEIEETVPLRERFVITRDNIPNKRRKQLREQFMPRVRLVIKESVIPLGMEFHHIIPHDGDMDTETEAYEDGKTPDLPIWAEI